MNATRAIDLEDAEGLLAADREGLLRAASSAGAQVRAIAAAAAEGSLDSVRGGDRPRSVIWVAGRGTAETAGAILAATLGGAASEPIALAGEAPPWVGPLDVLIVAGDDPGDPALVTAAATGVRRGARVVVAAPYEGPLRDSDGRPGGGAGAAGLGCRRVRTVSVPGRRPGHRADRGRTTNIELALARRRTGRRGAAQQRQPCAVHQSGQDNRRAHGRSQVALAGDCAATLALARHGSSVLLRIAHRVVAAAGLTDAVIALRAGGAAASADTLFHDEEIDGPLPERLRVLALTLAAERTVVAARVAGFDDVDLIGAEDVPDLPEASGGAAGCRRPAPGAPSNSWQYWPFGWRWPRFTCDSCGGR